MVADKASYHVTYQYKRHFYRKPKHGKQRLIDLPRSLMPELCAYIALLRKRESESGQRRQGRAAVLRSEREPALAFQPEGVQRRIELVCKPTAAGVRCAARIG